MTTIVKEFNHLIILVMNYFQPTTPPHIHAIILANYMMAHPHHEFSSKLHITFVSHVQPDILIKTGIHLLHQILPKSCIMMNFSMSDHINKISQTFHHIMVNILFTVTFLMIEFLMFFYIFNPHMNNMNIKKLRVINVFVLILLFFS